MTNGTKILFIRLKAPNLTTIGHLYNYLEHSCRKLETEIRTNDYDFFNLLHRRNLDIKDEERAFLRKEKLNLKIKNKMEPIKDLMSFLVPLSFHVLIEDANILVIEKIYNFFKENLSD